MIAIDKLDFNNQICYDKTPITFTFHIVLQNDNPLVTMPFDPDHLMMTCHKTIKHNMQRQEQQTTRTERFHDAVLC